MASSKTLIEDEEITTDADTVEDEETLTDEDTILDEEVLPPEDEIEEEAILSSEVLDNSDVLDTAGVSEEDLGMLSDENLDKVEEYFRLKGVMRTLRNDLKDHKAQMPDNQELDKLTKKVKELREKVKDDETVKTLTEKMQTTKERVELLKELIRIELLETAKDEVKRHGRKLKLVHILKEMKDQDENAGKGGKKAFSKGGGGKSIFRN